MSSVVQNQPIEQALPEFPRGSVPDARSWTNRQIAIREMDGSVAPYYSNGVAWVTGDGGVNNFTGLVDATTAPLPTTNVPLANALAGKATLQNSGTLSASSTQAPRADAVVTAIDAAIVTAKNQAKSEIIGSAPSTLDTIQEISAALNNDADLVGSLVTSVGNAADAALLAQLAAGDALEQVATKVGGPDLRTVGGYALVGTGDIPVGTTPPDPVDIASGATLGAGQVERQARWTGTTDGSVTINSSTVGEYFAIVNPHATAVLTVLGGVTPNGKRNTVNPGGEVGIWLKMPDGSFSAQLDAPTGTPTAVSVASGATLGAGEVDRQANWTGTTSGSVTIDPTTVGHFFAILNPHATAVLTVLGGSTGTGKRNTVNPGEMGIWVSTGSAYAAQLDALSIGGSFTFASITPTTGVAGATSYVLNIAAGLSGPIQWQRSANGTTGWADISGATSAVYDSVDPADAGKYLRAWFGASGGIRSLSNVVSVDSPVIPVAGSIVITDVTPINENLDTYNDFYIEWEGVRQKSGGTAFGAVSLLNTLTAQVWGSGGTGAVTLSFDGSVGFPGGTPSSAKTEHQGFQTSGGTDGKMQFPVAASTTPHRIRAWFGEGCLMRLTLADGSAAEQTITIGSGVKGVKDVVFNGAGPTTLLVSFECAGASFFTFEAIAYKDTP